jgi:hypothetical protein
VGLHPLPCRVAAIVFALLSTSCAARPAAAGGEGPAERETVMLSHLLPIVRKADVIVAVTVTAQNAVPGEPFNRAEATVEEAFKLPTGQAAPKQIAYDLPIQGNETPQAVPGRHYILFLRRGAAGKEAGRHFLVDLSSQLRYTDENKEPYFRLVRQYLAVSDKEMSSDEVRKLLLTALQSRLPFFVDDAAKTAPTATGWTEAEIDVVREVLKGADHGQIPTGNVRDNLVALVVGFGTTAQAKEQARHELELSNPDAVYYGLSKRKEAEARDVTRALLTDQSHPIRLAALRVAGLLRLPPLLDAYEHAHRASLSNEDRTALALARKLTTRD